MFRRHSMPSHGHGLAPKVTRTPSLKYLTTGQVECIISKVIYKEVNRMVHMPDYNVCAIRLRDNGGVLGLPCRSAPVC